MPCALCHTRKEKRFCPAIHDRICAPCCGTEREVTLDCPSDCPYLQQARAHEKPRGAADLQASGAELFHDVQLTQQFTYEQEPLIVGLCNGIVKIARNDRAVRDRDVIAALTNMAKAYQRKIGSGLEFEEATVDAGQLALSQELHRLVAEYRTLESQHLGFVRLRDADVLRALVFLVRMAHTRTSGRPRSRAYIDFLTAMFPEKPAPDAASGDQPGRLIIP